MPTPALLLLIATLLPLASFALLLFIGRRMGTPLAGIVSTCFAIASCGLSMFAMVSWISGDAQDAWGYDVGPIVLNWPWLPIGDSPGQRTPGYLDVGIYLDSLTVVLFTVVTLVTSLVSVFSLSYMRGDVRFARYFTYLSLFCFSMLSLVLAGTVLQIFVFFELVGVCSYLLIGFWYERPAAQAAALKAFVMNRIGDVGLIVGLGIIVWHVGNTTLPDLWLAMPNAGIGTAQPLPNGGTFTPLLMTIAGIGLFCGAAGKSAQFPLHTWLPDAMEGPTPASALIHAATMVAAGVYLMARVFPILTPDAKLFIAVIATITITMGALVAVAQDDIKRVLAWSTVSQLGYMMLAIGVGSWAGALFHLVTHAFFKALLFLGAGSVIHAMHHEQDMRRFGGLVRKIPLTAFTFGIAVLAIAGTPFLSGFFSKEAILAQSAATALLAVDQGRSKAWMLLFIIPTMAAYVTAFYMARSWMLTFAGKARDAVLHEDAKERPVQYGPMIMLAIFTVVAGYAWFPARSLIAAAQREAMHYCDAASRAAGAGPYAGFATAWPSEALEAQHATNATGDALAEPSEPLVVPTYSQTLLVRGHHLAVQWATWAFAAGLGLGFLIYVRGYRVEDAFCRFPPVGWVRNWLARGMDFDALYDNVFVTTMAAGVGLARWIDRRVIDSAVNAVAMGVKGLSVLAGMSDRYVVDGAVTASAAIASGVGAMARGTQSGRVRGYVTILVIFATVGLAAAVVFATFR